MADLGGNSYPLDIRTAEETTAMKFKWIAVKRQELKSRLVRLNQDIDDIKNATIIALERQILQVQQELDNTIDAENALKNT